MRFLRTNTATRITCGPFLDKTDGITPESAITVTSEKLTFVVDDAGVPTLVLDVAPTASGGANDMVLITGNDSGYYDLELAAANVNYLGRAVMSLNDVAVHCPVFHEFMILTANAYDSLFGTDVLDASVTQWTGTAVAAPDTAGFPKVTIKDGTGTGELQTASGVVDANVVQINASTVSVDNLQKSTLGVVTGVVGAASSTTSVVTSSLAPAAAVTDQFKGKIITFAEDTTTTNLRGQASDITASTSGGVLTVTALTTSPVSGDTFAIT